MFPEALMLHYLDDLDSKMESMRAHFQREPGAEWTTYNASLARPLLNSKNFLEKLQAASGGGAPAVQPDAVQPDVVQPEAVRPDNVLESSKAAAAKEN
jgi:3'-5' exoribonuclease